MDDSFQGTDSHIAGSSGSARARGLCWVDVAHVAEDPNSVLLAELCTYVLIFFLGICCHLSPFVAQSVQVSLRVMRVPLPGVVQAYKQSMCKYDKHDWYWYTCTLHAVAKNLF